MASGAPFDAMTNCLCVARGLPDLRHGEEIGTKTVGVRELPVGAMQMLGPSEARAAKLMEGLVHGVEGFGRTGEKAELDKVMKRVRQARVFSLARLERLTIREPQLGDGHPVFGQSAGLVGAEHRRGAECLDRSRPPRQHPALARCAMPPSP